MNIREHDIIRAPTGKADVCTIFTIDTPDEPFVLQGVAEPDTQYTLSFYAKSDIPGSITVAGTTMDTDDDWKRYVVTFIADAEDVELEFDYTGTYYLYNTQLEIGCKDTDFALNPADTEIGLSDLTVVVNNHTTQFSILDGKISALIAEDATIRGEYDTLVSRTTDIEVNLDGITSRVALAETDLSGVDRRLTEAESTIVQQADEIALTVKEQDVTGNYIVGKLNLSSTTAKIAAKNIDLSGYVTVSSLKTAGSTEIDGSNITTGTISADRIDADALMTKKLTATNLTVTGNSVFSGKLSGATGDFNGKITATSGKIGGWAISNSRILSSETIYMGAKEAGVLLINETDKPFIMAQDAGGKPRFVVSRDGTVTATNAAITGDITANSLAAKCTIYLQNPNNTSAGSSAISYDGAKLILNGDYGGNQIGNGTINYGPLWVYGSGIELHYSTPYIDFHYGDSTSDYTSRIIEESSGVLAFTGAIRPYGGVITEAGIYRKPVGSSNEDGAKCSVLKTKVNSSGTYYFTLSGQWGTTGNTYTTKSCSMNTSDIRLKTNIFDTDITALPVINQMQVRQFDWKENGIHQKIGFVADELELIDPALAIGGGCDEDGEMDIKSVNDFYLAGYLTKGIQELYSAQLSQADELFTHKSQIDYLLDENAALKKRVKELEKQIA